MGNSEYNKPSQKDADLIETLTLPASATTTYSGSFDLGHANPKHDVTSELKVNAPAVGDTALPATQTLKYAVQDSADDSSFSTIQDVILTQTGVTGGIAATTVRTKLPSTTRRYVRVACTKSGAGDASGLAATCELLF